VFGVTCAAPGLRAASTGALDLGPDVARDFALEPATGGEIRGVATCGGAACGGVLVVARQGDRALASGLSSASGAYVVPGLDDGAYLLRAIRLGHDVLDIPGVEVSAALPATVDFTLTPNPGGFTLSGLIGLSDNPLDRSGSQLLVHGQPGLATGTDAGGAYRLAGVPPGLISVAARHPGYDPRDQIDVLVSADRSLSLSLSRPSGPTDPVFRLSGVVRLREPGAAETTTAAGCRVSLWSEDDREAPFRQVVRTGADGAYAIPGAPAGDYRAGAALEGYLDQVAGPFRLDADASRDFELERDPGHDFGPGTRDGELGCGAGAPAQGLAGLALGLLALLALRARGRAPGGRRR